MSTAPPWIHSLLEKLEELDIETKIRVLKRYPRRRVAVFIAIVLFILYVLFSGDGKDIPTTVQQCVNDKLLHLSDKFDDLDVGVDQSSVSFVGNGHIGVDSNGELRIATNGSRVLDFVTGFYPFVTTDVSGSSGMAESTITDFLQGTVKKIKCFLVENECACVLRSFSVHRTRINVIIEEVQIINPTKYSLNLDITRTESKGWNSESAGDVVVQTKTFPSSSSIPIHAAVMCSNTPGKTVVMQKREESYRFTCIVEQREIPNTREKDAFMTNLSSDVIKEFSHMKAANNVLVDQEHIDAWGKLNSISFHLSHSKAPLVLNGDRINATRYLILSNVKAPTLEVQTNEETKRAIEQLGRQSERCYTGHSTLLYPSRLWQQWDKPENLIKMADLWLLTLEKRGCSNVVKRGGEGVAQALVLSLTACSFHDGHLEMEMAASELHREMSFSGIPIGSGGSTVAVRVVIETDNRPYLEVSSTSTLYACDGGCLDEPVTLAKTYTRMPIKVTKPQTSILYVATSRKHLEQLKSAIHVSEVGAAPAHEEDVLSLHRHGSRLGGLPTSVWVVLGVLLIAFHVFLAKLLWSEWRKGDMTPYNPYLRSRYSYVRSN